MTGDDELRQRLRRLDPIRAGVPIRSHGPTARHHLEQIMDMDIDTEGDTQGTTDRLPDTTTRRRWIGLGAAAAVAALIAGGVMLAGDDSQGPPLALSAGSAGGTLSSCIALTPEVLAQTPVAFQGTVTAVEGDVVTLDVDHWYTDGSAATAEVTAVQGMGALIGEIEFVAGEQYLISAVDGVVNLCGFSGPATPELQETYDQAFPG